jgi:hypothetical protein
VRYKVKGETYVIPAEEQMNNSNLSSPHGKLTHLLEVLDANGDVLVIGFLRKVKHVRGEEGFAILGKVRLVGFQHAIEPREELLRAVIRVHDDGDAVVRGHGAHVKGEGYGTGGASVLVRDRLTGHELTSSVGCLNHDGGVALRGGFHYCVRGGGAAPRQQGNFALRCQMETRKNLRNNCLVSQFFRGDAISYYAPGAVECRDGISVVFRVLEELDNVVSGDNTNGNIAWSHHFWKFYE